MKIRKRFFSLITPKTGHKTTKTSTSRIFLNTSVAAETVNREKTFDEDVINSLITRTGIEISNFFKITINTFQVSV